MSLTTRQKPPAHHKKTRGAHHRHSKHYLKTYWPYLPLMMLVVIGLAVNSLWSTQHAVLGSSTDLTGSRLLAATNDERSRDHEDALLLNGKLSTAAQAKANDMVTRNYWSHDTPDGRTPWSFIARAAYSYQAAGENLAYGFPDAGSTVTGWMNSTEHRANILNASYRDIGFGVANAVDFQGHGPATVIVALYGEPVIGSAAGQAGGAVLGAATSSPPLRSIARIQLLTHGLAPWSLALASGLSLLAGGLFLLRHGRAWRRVVVGSESFILEHKLYDLLFITVAVAGFILCRTAGSIH